MSGIIFRDESFLPYKGKLPEDGDLVVTQQSGDSWISLTNGTYLIPATHNEASRRYLNFMVGDAKSFDK